ncbi:MAG: hypothetical protein OEZ01_04335 [Candidatus Heimdallarchaeota archaeon]|nr:hypothetical protein [Candidatus Heimdallarchaeota archaeon]
MTKDEHDKFYRMFPSEFKKLQTPTAEQCLVYLRGFQDILDTEYIRKQVPEKHYNFCKIQLKLEGLL